MIKLPAVLGLLALSIPVLAVACGGAPSDEGSETSSEALVTIPPVNTDCTYANIDWSTADQDCDDSSPNRLEHCNSGYTALLAQVEANCIFPQENAYQHVNGVFFAWCTPGTYPSETKRSLDGDCREPPLELAASKQGYTQLVAWNAPPAPFGSQPAGCRMVVCLSN